MILTFTDISRLSFDFWNIPGLTGSLRLSDTSSIGAIGWYLCCSNVAATPCQGVIVMTYALPVRSAVPPCIHAGCQQCSLRQSLAKCILVLWCLWNHIEPADWCQSDGHVQQRVKQQPLNDVPAPPHTHTHTHTHSTFNLYSFLYDVFSNFLFFCCLWAAWPHTNIVEARNTAGVTVDSSVLSYPWPAW